MSKNLSDKLNLISQTNLISNIDKLCNSLRESGFHSYANEIESKFILFNKEAKSKEPGESLLEEAHKEKEITYSDSVYGVVENLLNQHKKILDIVNKSPSGKLASKDILSHVKTVLSQQKVSNEQRKQQAYFTLKGIINLLNFAKSRLLSIEDVSEDNSLLFTNKSSEIINYINSLNEYTISLESVIQIIKLLYSLKKIANETKDLKFWAPSFLVNKNTNEFNVVIQDIDGSLETAKKVNDILNGYYDDTIYEYYSNQTDVKKLNNEKIFEELDNKINSLLKDLKSWKAKIATSDFDQEDQKWAINFVENQFISKVNKIKDYLNEMNKIDKLEEASKEVDKMLTNLVNDENFIRFEAEWIDG